MTATIRSLLPDSLSDKEALHLIDFFYQLVSELESIYCGQILRYYKSIDEEMDSLRTQFNNSDKNPLITLTLEDPPF